MHYKKIRLYPTEHTYSCMLAAVSAVNSNKFVEGDDDMLLDAFFVTHSYQFSTVLFYNNELQN